MAEPKGPKHLWKAIKLHEDGVITETELRTRILETVAPDNIAEVVAALPASLIEDLKQTVDWYPQADEEWDRLLRIWGGTRAKPHGWTDDQYMCWLKEQEEAEKRALRRGVETLRAFFQPKD